MLKLNDFTVSARWRTVFIIVPAAFLMAILPLPRKLTAADNSQRVFPSPHAAVDALVSASKQSDFKTAVAPIFGPDADKILSSGDKVADENARLNFLKRYNEMHRLAYDGEGRVILYVGADNWPLPIPLVKTNNGWMFDTAAGEQELLYRRIGANEIYTIDVLENLVAAQNEYASEMSSANGVKEYARKILSDEGKHNGLYWPVAAGEAESPIGPLIAKAVSEGYHKGAQGEPIPFHGYIYRVLTGQGKAAPGGAKSYIHRGKMTRGFAFLAYPAGYRTSGVMSFIVNQDGVVFQKDLGPDTAKAAQEMTLFNPDDSWERVEPEPPPPEQS
jgi:hypothetical protein